MYSSLERIFIENKNVLDISFIDIKAAKSKKVTDYINLSDLIAENISDFIFIDTDKDYNQTNKTFYNQYLFYRNTFTTLLFDNFRLLVLYNLYTILPELYAPFKYEIQDWLNAITAKKTKLASKFKELKNIHKSEKKEYIDFINGQFKYSIINVQFVSFLESSHSPLDTTKLLRDFQLNSSAPFIQAREPDTNKRIVKFYKDFNQQDLLKKWLSKEKVPNNLIIKLKDPFTQDFVDVKVSKENSRMSVKLSFKQDSGVTIENCKNVVLKLLKPLNFKMYDSLLINSVAYFEIKKPFSYYKLFYIIKEKFSHIFTIIPKNVKNVLQLRFTSDEMTIININSKKSDGITKVRVCGTSTSEELNLLIDLIILIFYNCQNWKTVKRKEIKNIKKLRKVGVKVNSVECQRSRQPVLYENTSKKESSKKYPYKIKSGGKTFVCENKDYPFPGYTSGNIICCFKKDQRNKLVFKRNTETTNFLVAREPDFVIIKKPIILTNKVLEANRLGILKGVKDFYRLGNLNDKNSAIHAMELLLEKNVVLSKIIVDFLSDTIFRSLCDGDLYNNVSFNDYKMFLLSDRPKNTSVVELLAKYYNVCVIILPISSNFEPPLILNGVLLLQKNKKIYVIKKSLNNVFEPVVRIVSNTQTSYLERSFIKSELPKKFFKFVSTSKETLPDTTEYARKGFIILNQFINAYNKVTFIECDKGILPTRPCGLLLKFKSTFNIYNFELRKCKTQHNFLEKAALQMENELLRVTSQITENGGKNDCIGLVTKSNIIVPTLKSTPDSGLSIVPLQFFADIDNKIKSGKESENKAYNVGTAIEYYKEMYQRLRFTVSEILKHTPVPEITSKTLKTVLQDFIDDTCSLPIKSIPFTRVLCHTTTSKSKIKNATDDPFCKNGKLCIPKTVLDIMLKKIILDITQKNKNGMQILNGNVGRELLDDALFVKRKNEKVLLKSVSNKNNKKV